MGYDIKDFHIDDDSPEGRVVRSVIEREGVTPEEAVRVALRRGGEPKTPAEEVIGLFSDPEDLRIFEEAMAHVRQDPWMPKESDR